MAASKKSVGTRPVDSKPERKLESVIVREICDWLSSQGYFFWRSNNVPVFARSGNKGDGAYRFRSLPKYTPKGLPDIIVIYRGMFIGLEVKREGEKLKPHQAAFGLKIIEHGGFYTKVSSVSQVANTIKALQDYAK